MKLVDTSAWIASLRPGGDPAVSERVRSLLNAGEAAWCAMVRLELWNGARGEHEKRVLREMESQLIDLEMSPEVWARSFDLARKARGAGLSVPAVDILIAATAWHHGASIEHCDDHFNLLAKWR